MMEDSGKFIEKMLELGIGMSMIQQMPALIDGVMPKPAVPGTANGATPPPVKPAAPASCPASFTAETATRSPWP